MTGRRAARRAAVMARMSWGAVWAHDDRVEPDQGEENAIKAIEDALQECERESPGGGKAGRGVEGSGNGLEA